MQNNTIKLLSVIAGSAILLTSCDGLGKMVKKQDLITHDVTPKPLEEKADSVAFTISGKYPAKVFAKKATVTITPVIVFNGGGEKSLEPIVLLGEKAVGNGQKIPFDKGGTYTKAFSTAYEPGMKNAKLEIHAKGIFAKDAFVKTAPANQVTHIYYVINQSTVRPTEMKSEEMKNISKFI